jgi:hypothetical protein
MLLFDGIIVLPDAPSQLIYIILLIILKLLLLKLNGLNYKIF